MLNKKITIVLSVVLFLFFFNHVHSQKLKAQLNDGSQCPQGYGGAKYGESSPWRCLRMSCKDDADCAQNDCGQNSKRRPICGGRMGPGCQCATQEEVKKRCRVDTDCAWGVSGQEESIFCGCFNKESTGFSQTNAQSIMPPQCQMPPDSQKACECYDFQCQTNKGCNELTKEIQALMEETAVCNSNRDCYRDNTDLGAIGVGYVRSHLFDGDNAVELLKEKAKTWSEQCQDFLYDFSVSKKVRCKKHKCESSRGW